MLHFTPVKFATTTLHDGFQFTLHRANEDGSKRMRCSCHRAEKKCNAVIKVMPDGAVIPRGEHAPGCMRRNGIDLSWVKGATILNDDVQDLMHQWVEKHSVSSDHSHQAPKSIWQDCVAHFCEHYGESFVGLSRYQVSKLVYNARQAAFGYDTIAKVEQLYSSCKGKAFLQYSAIFSDNKGPQCIMVFSTKELMSLLEYPKVSPLMSLLRVWRLAQKTIFNPCLALFSY